MALSLNDILDVHNVIDYLFYTVQKALDGDVQSILILGLLFGLAQRSGFLKPSAGTSRINPQQLATYIYRGMLKNANFSVYDTVSGKYIPLLTSDQIKAIEKLSKDTKYAKQLFDKKAMLNKTFRNAQRIADSLGAFGYIEANKAGRLTVYKNASYTKGKSVLIPFRTMGDSRVCKTCRGLSENGPYQPNEFPFSPHPLCRCEPGDPIVKDIDK